MELITRLTSQFVAQESAMLPVFMAILVFGCIFLISFEALRGLRNRAEIRRRAKHSDGSAKRDAGSLNQFEKRRTSNLFDRIGKMLGPGDAESNSLARRELIRAGFFSRGAVPVYNASRGVLGLAFPALSLPVIGILPLSLSANQVIISMAVAAGLGFIGPSFYIRHRQKKMTIQYRTAFPDFMDLMVVCVESGLALQPAIERVSREMAPTTPQLAANLHLVNLELRAGSSLGDALDNLSDRLDLAEASSLASLLKQSDELGSSLSSALRVYSDEMRDKRLMRAEAMAHSLPVKITLPVGFCIFPVILVMLFLPLFLRIKVLLLT